MTCKRKLTWQRACKQHRVSPKSSWGQAFRNGWIDAMNGIRLCIVLCSVNDDYRLGYYHGQEDYFTRNEVV